jgi:hypothetical protein
MAPPALAFGRQFRIGASSRSFPLLHLVRAENVSQVSPRLAQHSPASVSGLYRINGRQPSSSDPSHSTTPSLCSRTYSRFAFTAEGERRLIVRGQTAKALIALVNAGGYGVTALEAATWAYRFAAYCFELRTRYGLVIHTEREEHPGGWHGRHVLQTPAKILLVADPEQEADAA